MPAIEMQTTTLPLDICLVSVRGQELDLSNVGQFKERMTSILKDKAKIVLDMNEVSFVDSAGFAALFSCLRDLDGRGGDLKLCRVQQGVRKLLDQVRMNRVVGIHDTADQAFNAFAVTAIVAPLFTPARPSWMCP